ncbi:MAG: sensor histidine kinase [Bacteroidota bacterium]
MLKLNDEYADLTRELYKKNSELQKLNELKNQFLGIAAHDLRNPIGNIISIASLLHEELYEKLSTKEKKFLTVIAELGEFGLNLLNDLLEISRIESNRKKLEVSKTDPNILIREIIKFNKYYADSQNVSLIFKSPGRIQPILTNKQAFHQILNNLISNGIKYSPEKTKVEVGVIPGDINHTFYVKDEGPGIPGEEQDKLFKPFSKTSIKPRGNEKSTGLGLWIVNMLVRSHSGNIWLESSEGKGTIIFFSIPTAS